MPCHCEWRTSLGGETYNKKWCQVRIHHRKQFTCSPQDWFKAFLPIHDGSAKNPHQSNNCWTHRWAMFTNTKALSMGAGVEGGIYSTFQPFSYLEIEQFIGLYILQGLNPSPKVDSKFHSQLDDPIQGNDLCYRVFGSNASK